MDCLNPHSVLVAPEGMKTIATKLIVALKKLGHFTADEAKNAEKQYNSFVDEIVQHWKVEFRDFDASKERLDDLYNRVLGMYLGFISCKYSRDMSIIL